MCCSFPLALAENVTNSLRGGMEVLVTGEWLDDSYTDEEGQRHVRHVLEARSAGPGLRWATATVTRTARSQPATDPPDAGPPEPTARPPRPPDTAGAGERETQAAPARSAKARQAAAAPSTRARLTAARQPPSPPDGPGQSPSPDREREVVTTA